MPSGCTRSGLHRPHIAFMCLVCQRGLHKPERNRQARAGNTKDPQNAVGKHYIEAFTNCTQGRLVSPRRASYANWDSSTVYSSRADCSSRRSRSRCCSSDSNPVTISSSIFRSSSSCILLRLSVISASSFDRPPELASEPSPECASACSPEGAPELDGGFCAGAVTRPQSRSWQASSMLPLASSKAAWAASGSNPIDTSCFSLSGSTLSRFFFDCFSSVSAARENTALCRPSKF
mmetsp:Transcript_11732/g.20400  ORF Transcript_11732/g.20400 Transcript_11732/m.20400 type:complete len:234 (+) Transcript_11732:158-859(+)